MIRAELQLARATFVLDVRLALPGQGVTALFGPSGCGKTTVLRALAGLERARGRIEVDGEVWQDDTRFVPPHRRRVGYVIQESSLFPHLDVRRNLDYAARRGRGPGLELAHIIELMGIASLLRRRPDTLSGGERQRVAIARALASRPGLLLMDEPLAALDAARKAELLPLFDRLHESLRIPVIYVSHAVDEVARLADRVVRLDAGRVVAEGPVTEMLARMDLPLPPGESVGAVFDAVIGERDADWQLVSLQIEPGGFALWARDTGLASGRRVRVRVLARDVSLSLEPQQHTSIGNQLAGTVEALSDDEHPALALCRVRVGAAGAEAPLLARLTRRSAHRLGLAPGTRVWAQVKSVALLEPARA